MENLRANNGLGGGKALIAIDELGAARARWLGYRRARGSNPFWPARSGGRILLADVDSSDGASEIFHNATGSFMQDLRWK